MRKSLFAFTCAGLISGAACAQSNVAIYGVVDGGLRYLSNVDAAGDHLVTAGGNGIYRSNRIGFQGREDLGGEMNVHFNLETRFKIGTGEQVGVLFNGFSYVGVGGKWGTIDIGRQYTLAFKTASAYDPFAMKYPSLVPNTAATFGTQDNNALTYTGTFGAVTARAMYAAGEQPGSVRIGATEGLGLNYARGPLDLGGAYTERKSTTGLNRKHATFGGGYKISAFRLTAGHARQADQVLLKSDDVTRYTWTGLEYDVNPLISFTGAFYQIRRGQSAAPTTGKKDLLILSATYALSKRSLLYAEIDRSRLSGNLITVAQTDHTGMAAGLNHHF